MKELQFMDAFLVVGKKGDWLKVVKYDPTQIKSHGRRLGDYKSASYYGWVHKSDLLLTRSSVTDLATGLKINRSPYFRYCSAESSKEILYKRFPTDI